MRVIDDGTQIWHGDPAEKAGSHRVIAHG